MNLTPNMMIPAIKTSMKSIESGVSASFPNGSCGHGLGRFPSPSGYIAVILSQMAWYMPNHVPAPIWVTQMGGTDPPTQSAEGFGCLHSTNNGLESAPPTRKWRLHAWPRPTRIPHGPAQSRCESIRHLIGSDFDPEQTGKTSARRCSKSTEL